MERRLSYGEAILEAIDQLMQEDESVLVFGLDVDDPKGILGTTVGLQAKYASERVFSTPLSEDAMTGVAIGMSLGGLRPIHVHIRMDFLLLTMNQLVNMAAKTRYMFGGQFHVPIVVRCIIGKSWGQGAQHSQGLYAMLMNIPGIRIVAPTTPYDAKGCLMAAVRDDNPVVFMEHRLLYYHKGYVPEAPYSSALGRSRTIVRGQDATLVGVSHMIVQCQRAQRYLDEVGVKAELIDPVWLAPLDTDPIVESVSRTRRLCVVDNGWVTCGAGAEIVAQVLERLGDSTGIRVRRMGFAAVTCPTSPALERHFYPKAEGIAAAVYDMVAGKKTGWYPTEVDDAAEIEFRGPF